MQAIQSSDITARTELAGKTSKLTDFSLGVIGSIYLFRAETQTRNGRAAKGRRRHYTPRQEIRSGAETERKALAYARSSRNDRRGAVCLHR